jgi:ATP-dependent Lon protease
MTSLNDKLNTHLDGKVVRKDLVQRVKKGTNVPTFVLEFLLARYCASDDPAEIKAGLDAVLSTLSENYVRPDEANAAQSKVATTGTHRFIDKVHVRYQEKEKRHWAALENFNSQRIAIAEKFYKNNDRLLEGGIWAEVTIGHNDIEDDDYAFFVEDLRPVQLSRFDYDGYCEGRTHFTRDEWLDVVLRSVGIEPTTLSFRVKLHFLARLASLVEANFNFIELGPRGTGKSYFFSEFSPYSTLISGGQATKAVLFYNNARSRIGLVGFWDTVAFDEVAGIKVKDPDTIQIMKDFMANGRFSRGAEVIADASLAFIGNIDQSIEQLVNSPEHDLFQPLPKQFDLAIMDRFSCYLPGWEMPKASSDILTNEYGLITDYIAEAFHYQLKHVNRYEEVNSKIKFGRSIEGRDEKGVKKTVSAFLKLLHPDSEPTEEEFDQYVEYALESRRRVKEQMNKRKPDDEFANINLSYFNKAGEEVVVYCPESKNAKATQKPERKTLEIVSGEPQTLREDIPSSDENVIEEVTAPVYVPEPETEKLIDQHFTIMYGETGRSYESIIGPYLAGAKSITIEDPYIRARHQLTNFVRFCEAVVKAPAIRQIILMTNYNEDTDVALVSESLSELKQSLLDVDVELVLEINEKMHDREIRIDNGWIIKIGRGLDFYQRPESWFGIGANDLTLRPCMETKVDIYRSS